MDDLPLNHEDDNIVDSDLNLDHIGDSLRVEEKKTPTKKLISYIPKFSCKNARVCCEPLFITILLSSSFLCA